MACFLHSPRSIVHRTNFFNFNEVQLIHFFFLFWIVFLVWYLSHHKTQGHVDFLSLYLLISKFNSFMFTLRFKIHLALIFMCKVSVQIIFFECGYPALEDHLLEIILLPLNCFFSPVKDDSTTFIWIYVWALRSILLIYLSFLFSFYFFFPSTTHPVLITVASY